jgi:hypothetical protein
MQVGDIVKLKAEWCENDEEAGAVFKIIDIRRNEVSCTANGTRILIELQNSGMCIAPTEYATEDMIEVQ